MAEPKPQDPGASSVETPGPATRRLLQRVYGRLCSEATTPAKSKRQTRLIKLTGLHHNKIKLLRKGQPIPITLPDIDRQQIATAYRDNLLQKKNLPTTMLVYSMCQDYLPSYLDLAEFRKLLHRLDFVWKKMPHFGFVVLERPEVTYERYKYLKAITANGTDDIYFVEENGYCQEDCDGFYELSDCLNSEKKIENIIYAYSNNEIIFNSNFEHEFTHNSFKDWIVGYLLPNLQKPSVIVFSNVEHHSEMLPEASNLSIESLRCEMTDWLDANNVPYDQEMSKVELYSLIENCTDPHANKYVIDKLLSTYGHTPLRIPNQIVSLTPGQQIFDFVKIRVQMKKSDETVIDRISTVLSSFKPALLKEFFHNVFAEYTKLLDCDLRIDQSLDDQMKLTDSLMALDSDCEDSDFPSISEDSD